jgi:hypothetical protein
MMKKEITSLQVGEPFPMFENSRQMVLGQDGCVMEILPEDEGYILSLYMRNMTKREFECLRYEKIKCSFIQEGDFILTLIKYGNTDLIFEISLDPTLYKDGRGTNFLKSNMITIVGIESTTNIVNTLRHCSIPVGLYKKWITVWDKAKDIENYSQKYTNWMNDLDDRYSVEELWNIGVYAGEMGE